jgi:thiamine pyrophosphokinase
MQMLLGLAVIPFITVIPKSSTAFTISSRFAHHIRRQSIEMSMTSSSPQEHDICHVYSPLLTQEEASKTPVSLVILNTPISSPPSPLFSFLWNRCSIRMCADGGANRLYTSDKNLIPNVIRGDLDSLHDSVRDYYASKGVEIEQDPDQDTNDLDKALQKCLSLNRDALIVIYGGFGGRFDQEMASFQVLYKWQNHFKGGMWLYNDFNCAYLVGSSKKYAIHLSLSNSDDNAQEASSPSEGPTCGLIPLGEPCQSLTTDGFQWNLDHQPSAFGGLVSTSNHLTTDVVTIEASHPIIFTAEVHSGSKSSIWH